MITKTFAALVLRNLEEGDCAHAIHDYLQEHPEEGEELARETYHKWIGASFAERCPWDGRKQSLSAMEGFNTIKKRIWRFIEEGKHKDQYIWILAKEYNSGTHLMNICRRILNAEGTQCSSPKSSMS